MEMEFETHVPSGVTAADTRGKHRILAELKRLDQETRSLEEEMDELEKTDKVSVACKELLLHIEARPDPLLPVTNGPTNPLWDRWFEGPQDSQGCRCWDPLFKPNHTSGMEVPGIYTEFKLTGLYVSFNHYFQFESNATPGYNYAGR